MVSVPELLIAAALIALGCRLWKRGSVAQSDTAARSPGEVFGEWARFCGIALPILGAAYIGGYFAFMDRDLPTDPYAPEKRFQSSFRWAPYEWVFKAKPPYRAPWRAVTTWNILYEPMDRFWFHFFPRSAEEVERLRGLGYYQ